MRNGIRARWWRVAVRPAYTACLILGLAGSLAGLLRAEAQNPPQPQEKPGRVLAAPVQGVEMEALESATPAAQESAGESAAPVKTGTKAVVLEVNGVIGPPLADYLLKGIAAAQKDAGLIVLEMNTPGGLVASTFQINEAILGSQVPVVTYVTPTGAMATSAGTYIMYASHLAAMAPSTTVGAATPIDLGAPTPEPSKEEPAPAPTPTPGKEGEETAKDEKTEGTGRQPKVAAEAKAVNLLAAQIRGYANRNGRNAEWAERAVREAATLTSTEAVDQNVANFIAKDLAEVLEKANGRVVEIDKLGKRTVASRGLPVERIKMSWAQRLLVIISHPTVALILMQIGVLGLIVELYNPGAILPGVVGLICLIMGLFSLGQFPIDFVAAAFVILGLVFIALEVFVTSGGILALGGIVSFGLGALFLIDTPVPGFQVSRWFIIASTAVFGAIVFIIMSLAVAVTGRRPVAGAEHLIGMTGTVVRWSGNEGIVLLDGENWRAVSKAELKPGQTVIAVKLDGLTVTVKPA